MKDPITAIPFKLPEFPVLPKIRAVENASNQTYGKFSDAKNRIAPASRQSNPLQQAQQPPKSIEKGKGGRCDLIC